jgi:putative sterol carrier protein
MVKPMNLTLRQMLEGMTLTFDATAAGDIDATLQFNVTGPEPGTYYLRIAEGDCTFHLGTAGDPALTIATPSDVWLKISCGELDAQGALMQGLYQGQGDLNLLMRMGTLFKTPKSTSDGVSAYAAPPDQRPAGPIALTGMTWMMVAFIPWILYWITFSIPGVSPWVSVGLPFLFSLFIVVYRRVFDKPTWMEWGGLGFFTLAGILTLIGNSTFAVWGSVISSIVMGALWLGTLVFTDMPLSANYSKWGYIKRMWRTSLFIHPNTAISLMWGWQFLVASLFGGGAILLPHLETVLTVIRYMLLVPAFVFTFAYQKGADSRPIANVDRALAQMRTWAIVGLVVAVGMVFTIWFAL